MNYLFLGFDWDSCDAVKKIDWLGEAQLESLHRLYLAADGFVGDGKTHMPGED